MSGAYVEYGNTKLYLVKSSPDLHFKQFSEKQPDFLNIGATMNNDD